MQKLNKLLNVNVGLLGVQKIMRLSSRAWLAGCTLCVTAALGSTVAQAVIVPGAVAATPSVYEVSVTAIDFINSNGGRVNFFTGPQVVDIASVNAGGAAAVLGAGRSLPVGTYTQMEVTFSGNFGMTGSVPDAGGAQACRTVTGGGNIVQAGYTVNAGAADGAAAQRQTISIPTGPVVLPANLTDLGGNSYKFTTPQNFVISESAAVTPALTVKFDVTNALEFLTTGGGACIASPAPPVVTVAAG